MKLRAIGVDLDRAFQVAQRFGQIRSLEEQRATQVVIDLGRVRSLGDDLAQDVFGLAGMPRRHLGRADPQHHVGIVGRLGERLLVELESFS